MEPDELCRCLSEWAEPHVKAFASSLIPGATTILGVRIPKLRALAKELAQGKWQGLFEKLLGAKTMEELLICGMLPGYAPRLPLDERLQAIRRCTPHLTNWCLCDTCCSTYRFARQNRAQVWDFLQPYLYSPKEFSARFGVVMLLSHYVKDAAWAPQVAAVLPQVAATGFYAEMAIGWCLCELHIFQPALAAPLLAKETSPLRPSVLAIAQRKIRESRRCRSPHINSGLTKGGASC